MEIEEIGVRARLGMRGLKNRGIIEISENPRTGDFVLVIGKGTRRKWLMFNLPEGMWRVRCKKEEVSEAVNKFLTERILS